MFANILLSPTIEFKQTNKVMVAKQHRKAKELLKMLKKRLARNTMKKVKKLIQLVSDQHECFWYVMCQLKNCIEKSLHDIYVPLYVFGVPCSHSERLLIDTGLKNRSTMFVHWPAREMLNAARLSI